jgi:hypothetical protein
MKGENSGKAAMEIFSIRAEGFELYAMLKTIEEGRSMVRGWTMFKGGEKCQFFSKGRDKVRLRKRVMRACIPIASFYGVEVVHKRIESSAKKRPVYAITENIGCVLH